MPCVRCGVTICCFKELADLSQYALTMAADNEGRTQWRTFQVDELMEVLKLYPPIGPNSQDGKMRLGGHIVCVGSNGRRDEQATAQSE